MAKNKTLTLGDLYDHVSNLTTADQKTLKDFIEKTLTEKATAAQEELNLINGSKIQSN